MPGAFLQNQAHTCWNDVGLPSSRKVTTFKKGAAFGVTLPKTNSKSHRNILLKGNDPWVFVFFLAKFGLFFVNNLLLVSASVHPGKLTWQWKNQDLMMYVLSKMAIFHCQLSFQGVITGGFVRMPRRNDVDFGSALVRFGSGNLRFFSSRSWQQSPTLEARAHVNPLRNKGSIVGLLKGNPMVKPSPDHKGPRLFLGGVAYVAQGEGWWTSLWILLKSVVKLQS